MHPLHEVKNKANASFQRKNPKLLFYGSVCVSNYECYGKEDDRVKV
jgi:hypothetical protein